MKIIDMDVQHLDYVARCGYTGEKWKRPEEVAEIKKNWLRKKIAQGMVIKVALNDEGVPVGFSRALPIDRGAWGVKGRDLLAVTCLVADDPEKNSGKKSTGLGRQLMQALESEARKQYMGICVTGWEMEYPYMPAAFFRKLGYQEVARQDERVLLLKEFEPVSHPEFREITYTYTPVPEKVTVDLIWNPLCMTSICELFTVRGVCAEFVPRVVFKEYCAGDPETYLKYGTERALFINGRRRDWGYDAPREGVIAEIEKELNKSK
ncbi:MAG: hypothetical protein PHW04_03965 [Candidatus Wallbacteria bacterium]|nr:hypothetical protein [Candidatus Wallbacteria bacterium]